MTICLTKSWCGVLTVLYIAMPSGAVFWHPQIIIQNKSLWHYIGMLDMVFIKYCYLNITLPCIMVYFKHYDVNNTKPVYTAQSK